MLYANDECDVGGILVLNGSYCERNQHALAAWAQKGRVSRIDIAIDEFPFSPDELESLWQSDQIVTRSNARRFIVSDSGSSFYIGSRQSERMVRVYDRRDTNRVELEAKGRFAHEIGYMLADNGALNEKALIAGMFRVVVEGRGQKRDRRSHEKWGQFCSEQSGLDALVPPKSATLERTLEWIRRSVAPTLANLRVVLTHDEYGELLSAEPDEAICVKYRMAIDSRPVADEGVSILPRHMKGTETLWSSS